MKTNYAVQSLFAECELSHYHYGIDTYVIVDFLDANKIIFLVCVDLNN